ncbi:MAG: HD-GYP domain-containing protein [Planctomycetota bacterium]|jgi:HD-GYP domain-containing protein (c-di-GMP phosphodiesterase class II)
MATATRSRVDIDVAERVAREFAAAVSSRRIYTRDHQRTTESVRKFIDTLSRAVQRTGVPTVTLWVTDELITYEGIPLHTSDDSAMSLVAKQLIARESGGIVFRGNLRGESVRQLVEWLIDRNPRPFAGSIAGIEILAPGATEDSSLIAQEDPLLALMPEFKVAYQIHQTANTVLEHVMDDMRADRKADFSEVIELTKWTAEAVLSQNDSLVAPTQGLHHDRFTFNHSVNVFLIATTLMQPFARDRHQLARFAQAALLHDVGKSKIPREVLYKKDRLTDEEFDLIKMHPIYGAELLQTCRHADALAIEVAYCHHMRDDGMGYPTPRLPIRPGPAADLVQVADMFEALTAKRPYSSGRPVTEALKMIIGTPGMASKKAAVAALLERLSVSPPGSQVKLNTGERALVLRGNPKHAQRPLIRVFQAATGKDLETPYELDLKDEPTEQFRITEVCLKPSVVRTAREATAVLEM